MQSRSRFGICERDLFNYSEDYPVSRSMDADKPKYEKMSDKRFPYGVIYQIAEGWIIIIAIMQMNRKPDYWKERII